MESAIRRQQPLRRPLIRSRRRADGSPSSRAGPRSRLPVPLGQAAQGPRLRKPARAAPQPTADSTVQKALAEPAELDFDQTSLKDVLEAIGIRHRINIILDEKSFNDASIPFETPITINVKGVSLRSALRLMLQQHDLNYLLDDGADNVLIITTDACRAKEHLDVRLFDVHELTPPPNEYLLADPEYDEIVEVITGTIAPQTWTSAGGAGSVAPFGDMLVVAQTDEVQAMIPPLLAALETARKQQQPAAKDSARAIPAASATPEDGLRPQLDARIDVDFDQTSLTDVADWFKVKGLPMQIDSKALGDANIPIETPITFNARNVRASWALKTLLKSHDLTYYVDQGQVLITTDAKAKERLFTRVYPVADLLRGDSQDSTAVPEADYDDLIEIITRTVWPTTWDSSGGPGSIVPVRVAKAIVVAQSADVHRQIDSLFEKMRAEYAAHKHNPPVATNDPNRTFIRVYHLLPSDDSRTVLPALPPNKDAPKPAGDTTTSQSDEARSKRAERYVALIKRMIEPDSWTKENVSIEVVEGRIHVARQTGVQVQARIKQLLKARCVFANPPDNSDEMRDHFKSTGKPFGKSNAKK